MRRSPLALGMASAALAAAAALSGPAPVAHADEGAPIAVGTVLIGSGTDLVTVVPNPGCNVTPASAFMITNGTDRPIYVSEGTTCTEPSVPVTQGQVLSLASGQYSFRY